MKDRRTHRSRRRSLLDPESILSLVLLLRYGTMSPSRGDSPILNLVTVARVTKLSPFVVTKMIRRYLSHGDTGDRGDTRPFRKLHCHHVGFLTSSETLQQWAPLSLKERSVLFHRHYPETVVSPSTLASVYRQHKIKFKQIKRGKRVIDFGNPYYRSMLADIHEQIQRAIAGNVRILFLDEAIFSFRTGPSRAWASNNETIEVDEASFNGQTQALIMAVSVDRGVDHFKIVPRSVTTREYLAFLEELRQRNGDQQLAIFMDNLKVHRSRLAQDLYPQLDIVPIFNVPYSPQFNGIEAVFSMVKAAYKKQLLGNILAGRTQHRSTLIR